MTTGTAPLLQVRDLTVTYSRRGRRLTGPRETLHAVAGVDLDVGAGEVHGLVGESGSGKSTLAQAVDMLVRPAAGSVQLAGHELTALRGRALRAARRSVQMVFQDPYSSLDPSMTVEASIAEPLRAHRLVPAGQRAERVAEALDSVGLDPALGRRYPHEFSGGQRQRIAIARALVTAPRLVILDEAVSALDVSTRGQVLRLLQRLRRSHDLSYLFIGHDLGVVRAISDRITVLYLGRVMETGPAERVLHAPAHPYTAALVASVPDVRGRRGHRPPIRSSDPPDPWRPPSGCPFRTRCPSAMEVCAQQTPAPVPVAGGGHVACHLHTSDPIPTPTKEP